jgi:protein involved in polysaccharide export with SLBB domain
MKKKFIYNLLFVFSVAAVGAQSLWGQQIPPYMPGTIGTFGVPGDSLGGRFAPPQSLSPYYFLGGRSPGRPPDLTGSLLPPDALELSVEQRNQRYCRWVQAHQSSQNVGETQREDQALQDQGQQVDFSDPRKPVPVESPWPGAPRVPTPSEPIDIQSVHVPTPTTPREMAPDEVKILKDRIAKLEAAAKSPRNRRRPTDGRDDGIQHLFFEPASTIEYGFQQMPNFEGTPPAANASLRLKQYGYSLFASPISTFAPIYDVPVGPDYILGPGDDMIINVWGAMESAVVRTIDRNGQIILPSVGPVRVWGLTFSQAEELIREQLASNYRGFQSNVTMGRLRAIKIYVVGEVCQPGAFTVSSLSTVTNALFSAGGPLKLGSLREIQLKRNHHTVGTVDLYDFLLHGDKTRDFRLQSGDTIFVPPIGGVAAIAGEIKRPAVYELSGTLGLSDLIEMAGGTTPRSYLKRVQIIRTKPNAEREVIDIDLTAPKHNGDGPRDIAIHNGDLVRIYPTDPRIYNSVTVRGSVRHPGEYQLKPGMRLSQILRQEVMLPEAHLDAIEVVRLKDDLDTEIIEVDLQGAWKNDPSQDIALRPRDLITVRSSYRNPGTILLQGEIKRPGVYTVAPGERLSSVLKRAGGYTEKAFFSGAVFTRKTVMEVEKKKLNEFLREQEQRLLADASTLTFSVTGYSRDDVLAQQAVLTQRREELRLVASKVVLGRVVVRLDDLDSFEGSRNDLILEDGDSLKIPQEPSTVMVMGSVRNPTSVIYNEEMDVQHYLSRAGGLNSHADSDGVYILKADGSAVTGFIKLRDVGPGDAIIVPPSTEAKIQWSTLVKDMATLAGQTALSLAALAAIF